MSNWNNSAKDIGEMFLVNKSLKKFHINHSTFKHGFSVENTNFIIECIVKSKSLESFWIFSDRKIEDVSNDLWFNESIIEFKLNLDSFCDLRDKFELKNRNFLKLKMKRFKEISNVPVFDLHFRF